MVVLINDSGHSFSRNGMWKMENQAINHYNLGFLTSKSNTFS